MSIEARPETFELSRSGTAVIVVDMQHDFAAPEGMFGRAGISLEGIRSVIEPTRRVLDAARDAGMLVVYLAMQFDEDLTNLGPVHAPNRVRHLAMGVGQKLVAPDGTSSRVLVRKTWNTQIVDELAPRPGDVLIAKHRYSGFFETELDEVLRGRAITSLIFTGCTTSVCRVHASRRLLPRLPMPAAHRLLRRSHRQQPRQNQPRRQSHRDRSTVRLDHRVRTFSVVHRQLTPIHRSIGPPTALAFAQAPTDVPSVSAGDSLRSGNQHPRRPRLSEYDEGCGHVLRPARIMSRMREVTAMSWL